MGTRTKSPWKHYVYIWLDVNGIYYVGRGQRRRGWEPHFGDKGVRTPAQLRRDKFNRSFRCMVVADGLKKKTAVTLEALLIQMLQPSCNRQQRNGPHLAELKRRAAKQARCEVAKWEEKGRKSLEVRAEWDARLGKSLSDHVQERESAKSERKKLMKALASIM